MLRKLYIWQKISLAALAAGAAASIYLYLSGKDSGPAETFNHALLTLFLAWAGALAGGLMDWARYRRSPFEPLFKNGFRWHYRQGYWLRFAISFCAGWTLFVLCAAGLAVAVGAKDEARAFYTIEGIALVVIFCFVFAFEGAVIGGIVDLFRHAYKKDGKKAKTV